MKIDSDLNVSLAATQEIPSILVIAGTGSAVIGRSAPETISREGGLGPILGDPGAHTTSVARPPRSASGIIYKETRLFSAAKFFAS